MRFQIYPDKCGRGLCFTGLIKIVLTYFNQFSKSCNRVTTRVFDSFFILVKSGRLVEENCKPFKLRM